MELIEWCNENEGFINAILSILTLTISTIALYSSIKLAYLPYRKRIIINPIFGMKKDKYNLELIIANTGNRLIGINYIIVKYNNIDVGSIDKKTFIQPSQTDTFYIDLNLHENDVDFKNHQIKIEICDTERKEYIFKTGLAMG